MNDNLERSFADFSEFNDCNASFDIGSTQLLDIPTQLLFAPDGRKTANRYDAEIKSESAFTNSLLDRIPANTRKATESAVRSYEAWRLWRETKLETYEDSNFPIPCLNEEMVQYINFQEWDYWLARYEILFYYFFATNVNHIAQLVLLLLEN